MLVVAQAAFAVGGSHAAEGPNLPPAEYKPLPEGTVIKYTDRTFRIERTEGYGTTIEILSGGWTPLLHAHALFGVYADNMFATRRNDAVFYSIGSASRKALEGFWPLDVGKRAEFTIAEESRGAYSFSDHWRIILTVTKTETLNLGGRTFETYVIDEFGDNDGKSSFAGRKWYHPASGLIVKSSRTWTKVVRAPGRGPRYSQGHSTEFSLVEARFPQGATGHMIAEKPARPNAGAAPTLPPAAYTPLPVGTRIVYDKAVLTVAKQDGFATVFKQQVGNTVTWPQFHAVFGEHGSDIHVSTARGGAVEFDLDADNKRKLEALWPLAVGKQAVYRLHEGRGGSYGGATQVWTITLKVSATETVEAGGRRVPTYVVDERAESDLGMSFTGRKWYDPARGLIVRSQRIGTGVNAVGDLAWDPKTARLGKDQEEIHTLRAVDYPPGAAPAAVAAVAPTPAATTKVPQPAPSTGPALPPAAYKPLPVGTKVKLDNGALTVARTDGFTTVLKQDGRDVSPWVSLHALFGEYGTNVFASDARGDPVEYDITSANKKKLESLWPLSVGKQATYRVREVGPSYYGEPQDWTIALKVAGTETVEIEGRSYQTYVVEERGDSSGGMGFTGRKWYHPATGLIVQSQRTGTGVGRVARTQAHLGSGQQSASTMRSVDFPPGTDSVLVAAAQGTITGGAPAAAPPVTVEPAQRPAEAVRPAAAPQVAKVEPAQRAAEAVRPAPAPQVAKVEPAQRPAESAVSRQQADDARKAREAEIAQLKQEAEQVFKAREADMAKRLKEAEDARRAEIAKLKQEADRALKAREAEIARLRQTLAERRDDKAGDAGSSFSGIDFGRYHALVIGIDNYKHLPKLNTAVNDARAIGELLEKEYGFVVTLLLEPTRNDIVDALDVYREKLGRTDNLLIYYAGHGWLDKEVDRGYWLPIDAEPKRRRDWVSNATITDTLKALSAKHVMVVADSCYSGTLVRSADMGARTRTGDYWKQMATKGARVAITSGGLEPVADAGGGGHSPFAKAFIDALGANASVMDGTTLFSQMRRPVMVNARQTPQYADVREAGHDGGDFLFVRKKK